MVYSYFDYAGIILKNTQRDEGKYLRIEKIGSGK
jgi:hypothetical protein